MLTGTLLATALLGCSSEHQIHREPEQNGYPAYGDADGPHDTLWYVFDDPEPHQTSSSEQYVVDHHGDPALYWYEPSGAHGMVGTTDPDADFLTLTRYVRQRAGEPLFIDEPLSFSTQSTLSTFEFATFTYVLCEFWVDEGDAPGDYQLSVEAVDDGMLVLLNARYVDHIKLAEGGQWTLDVTPGQTNAIVLILTDDSELHRYFSNIELTHKGTLIN